MTMSPNFRDYLVDQLEPFGLVAAKRMFGGGGLFRDGTMFALIADDVLYLKADEQNQADFKDRGELCQWAVRAWEAARRSGTGKKNKKKAGAAPGGAQ
jgi:TfoX/Sxy family transcriptional regulator of competence genes